MTQVDARKSTLKEEEALALVRDIDEVYSMKGRSIIHIDLRKEKPDNTTLAGMLLGPTGNLRAPTLRKGRILLVGFDPETYEKVLR